MKQNTENRKRKPPKARKRNHEKQLLVYARIVNSEPIVYTKREVADMCDTTLATISGRIRRGELKAIKLPSGQYRIPAKLAHLAAEGYSK